MKLNIGVLYNNVWKSLFFEKIVAVKSVVYLWNLNEFLYLISTLFPSIVEIRNKIPAGNTRDTL